MSRENKHRISLHINLIKSQSSKTEILFWIIHDKFRLLINYAPQCLIRNVRDAGDEKGRHKAGSDKYGLNGFLAYCNRTVHFTQIALILRK